MEKALNSVEEILADEEFQAWALHSDQNLAIGWEKWMKKNSFQQSLVDEAVSAIHQMFPMENKIPESQIELAFDNLLLKLPDTHPALVVSMNPSRKKWWWTAAVVILVAAGGYFWLNANQYSTIKTAFGQVEIKKLPDGTEVTLNANTNISYASGWDKGKEREVWLNGEAFFHVRKIATDNRFIVHASQMDIIVTGTQFNVVNRHNLTNVMLTEGSVLLKTKDGKEVVMSPGDYFEVNNNNLEKKISEAG